MRTDHAKSRERAARLDVELRTVRSEADQARAREAAVGGSAERAHEDMQRVLQQKQGLERRLVASEAEIRSLRDTEQRQRAASDIERAAHADEQHKLRLARDAANTAIEAMRETMEDLRQKLALE